jgi:hypothetical protein
VDVDDSRRTFALTLVDVMHDKILALDWFSEREFMAV